MSKEKTPHKHAAVIHAWADGEEIQVRIHNGNWESLVNCSTAAWFQEHFEYRIKPSAPETRMTAQERLDAVKQAGITEFSIGVSREKGADRLGYEPADVTLAIANAAIARALADGDVVLP